MKNILTLILICTVFTSNTVLSQIYTSQGLNADGSAGNASTSYAFLDASSSVIFNAQNYEGKGILFPRTDLTVADTPDDTVFNGALLGQANNNPNYYDGLVIFNTGTGAIPSGGMGSSAGDVSPGFYYYRNATTDWDGGTWVSMSSDNSKIVVGSTETKTNTTIGADDVYVKRFTGTSNGTDAHLLVDTGDLDFTGVKQLRKCLIYEGDNLVIEATAGFTTASGNNRIITGNGSIYTVLSNTTADAYTAECYYTKN